MFQNVRLKPYDSLFWQSTTSKSQAYSCCFFCNHSLVLCLLSLILIWSYIYLKILSISLVWAIIYYSIVYNVKRVYWIIAISANLDRPVFIQFHLSSSRKSDRKCYLLCCIPQLACHKQFWFDSGAVKANLKCLRSDHMEIFYEVIHSWILSHICVCNIIDQLKKV